MKYVVGISGADQETVSVWIQFKCDKVSRAPGLVPIEKNDRQLMFDNEIEWERV